MRTMRSGFALKAVAVAVLCLSLLTGGDVYAATDEQEDFNSYMEAAEQGDAEAQFNVGWCYYNNYGVTQDYGEAVKWYRKAAEQGNAAAQNNLGVCYANGVGVPQNWEEAVEWWRKAAEQGYAAAQFSLGGCYANGQGVKQDNEEAAKWYRKAAKQGLAVAQYTLDTNYGNDKILKRGGVIVCLFLLFVMTFFVVKRIAKSHSIMVAAKEALAVSSMDRRKISSHIRKDAVNVLMQVVAFIIYYVLLILLGVALIVGAGWVTIKVVGFISSAEIWSIRMFVILGTCILAMWWFCLQIGVYLLRPLFSMSNTAGEDCCEINQEDAPKLFSLVKEIAKATGNKMPKHIYMTADVNASVSYDSVSMWSLLFPGKKNLTIGIGLLRGLNISELKAILSHEFGHFSQQSMRIGAVTYRLLIVCSNMVEYARKEKMDDMAARASADYNGFFHLATYPISAIASMTINLFDNIMRRNCSLSRYMEFEADTVACQIAGSKQHISALCKTGIIAERFAIYEQMVTQLLQKDNPVKCYFEGYSFVYEQLANDDGLHVTCHDTLTQPVGDNALFPPRISVINGYDTHPPLQERIDNALRYVDEGEETVTDETVTLVERNILEYVGKKHQECIGKKHIVHWKNALTYEAFTQWFLTTSANVPPHFLLPFIQKHIASFTLPSEEDIESEDVGYPFNVDNRNLILEYNRAFTDMQTLTGICDGKLDAPAFIYNGKVYTDAAEPLKDQKEYVDTLLPRWKDLDLIIYKYLLRHAEDKASLKVTYWMKMYAGDALDSLASLHSEVDEIIGGLSFYRAHGGNVSVKESVVVVLRYEISNYLKTLDYEALSSICGEWENNDGKPVSQLLEEWKECAANNSHISTENGGVLGLIEQVWQFLQMMFNVADTEWQKRMIDAYKAETEKESENSRQK